jgi:hypothetical protein
VPLRWLAIVARNLVPVAGVLVLGWSAPHLVVSYFVDTLLGMTTALALVLTHLHPPREGERVPGLASAFATAGALAVLISIPLAGPVLFLLVRGGFDLGTALEAPAFRNALWLQLALAVVVFVRELRQQAGLPLETLGLRDRFGLLFVRWFALCVLGLSPIGVALGRAAAPALVVLYSALTVLGEIAPARLLGAFDRPAATRLPAVGPARRSRRRRSKRP